MSSVRVFRPNRILSSANAPDLMNWIQTSVNAGSSRLLINLQHVLFMDNSGIATLLTALKMVRQSGGNLALCCLTGQARMMFEIAGLDKEFDTYDSPADFEQACAES